MAKPHKHAGLRLLAATKLADADIALMARTAAEAAAVKVPQWSTVRLEKAEPGLLVFSVRGPSGLVEQMEFTLEAVTEGGATKIRSTITRYKQSQSTFAGFIPAGQKKMVGLSAYRKWIENLTTALQETDPGAETDVNGPLTSSVGEFGSAASTGEVQGSARPARSEAIVDSRRSRISDSLVGK